MPPVKGQSQEAVRQRFTLLLELLSPWGDERLGYRRFGQLVGADEEAVKTWMKRGTMPKGAVPGIIEAAETAGLEGVTSDWLLLGKGPVPRKGGDLPPGVPTAERSGRGGQSGRGKAGLAGSGAGAQYERREQTEDDRYLEWAMGSARQLADMEAQGVKPTVLLTLADEIEELGLAKGFPTKRVRGYVEKLRRDLRERHRMDEGRDRAGA